MRFKKRYMHCIRTMGVWNPTPLLAVCRHIMRLGLCLSRRPRSYCLYCRRGQPLPVVVGVTEQQKFFQEGRNLEPPHFRPLSSDSFLPFYFYVAIWTLRVLGRQLGFCPIYFVHTRPPHSMKAGACMPRPAIDNNTLRNYDRIKVLVLESIGDEVNKSVGENMTRMAAVQWRPKGPKENRRRMPTVDGAWKGGGNARWLPISFPPGIPVAPCTAAVWGARCLAAGQARAGWRGLKA